MSFALFTTPCSNVQLQQEQTSKYRAASGDHRIGGSGADGGSTPVVHWLYVRADRWLGQA